MLKKLKYHISFLLALTVLLTSSFALTAYASDAGLAVSAGKNFGDGVNTTQDAIDASAAYADAGLTAVTITSPTKSSFTTDYLRADVLFLSGHGNENVLSFGSNLKFACQSGTTSDIYINIWNTAQYQSIITFAGCNTAGGDKDKEGTSSSTSSITERAVDQGAGVAVGWTSTVSAGSHTNWLKRYNDALADGKTVAQAISTANSYIYLPGSGVKNVVYYGDGSITLSSIASRSVDNAFDAPNKLSKSNLSVLNEIKNLALKNQNGFDTDTLVGYVYEADNGLIVDAYFKCNGAITSSAITIQIGETGEVLGYKTHNITTTNLASVSEILSGISAKLVSTSAKNDIAAMERSDISDSETLVGQNQFVYYDVITEETYLVTYTEVLDDIGAKYVKENVALIN